jgi:GPH family glycoside/pentoside/hexuronide:cation symporter/probable glucitol transport protein GutA
MDTSLTKNKTDVSYSMLRKIGYGMGEAGSQLSWTLISSYLTVYYSDVVGLTPIIISTVMLVARILTCFLESSLWINC